MVIYNPNVPTPTVISIKQKNQESSVDMDYFSWRVKDF